MSPEPLHVDSYEHRRRRRVRHLAAAYDVPDPAPLVGTADVEAARTSTRCTLQHSGATLVWSHVRQVDARGRLIFELATEFVLDGRPISDRSGERFLDHTGHRVDGTQIIR